MPLLSLLLATFNFTFKQFEHWYFRAIVGKSVVKLIITDPNGIPLTSGTGFSVLGKDLKPYIVTNTHVCNAVLDGKIFINTSSGGMINTGIVRVSATTDLCLVAGSPKISPLRLAKSVIVGEPVRSIGYPAGGPMVVLAGEIIGYADFRLQSMIKLDTGGEFNKILMTSVFAIGGSSGSPIMDVFGGVVGIVFATRIKDRTQWAYAIPSNEIISFINSP